MFACGVALPMTGEQVGLNPGKEKMALEESRQCVPGNGD
jgi:hypothetical protein